MYLTQQTDYALRVLIYAAVNDEDLVNISTIAQTYNISKSHLMKVVTMLVKGGFLASVRGKGGGLRLGKKPEDIRVGAVVRLMEPLQIAECFRDDNQCLITCNCRLAEILGGGIKAFLNHLDGYTLADLLNKTTQDILYVPKIPIVQES
ncbi:RrF2 family transcriptional regulator [Kingella negevensis]|uniref:RrF2 family transcriptional regulator n=1 Tax=Kingella negevensis TaxID=1522312 RepID=UPI00254C2E8C|nr:Rrf2 family transcriptional regulator [Kingella negevensis]MDK4680676.1 Rrf2 family transcriptional regulator [Kingella negevensis]MDK4681601.1 Rrf2 family transcriptional regulator [Kingella negevensis]MDK4689799.1 Rrf2 family transcriptional regulator [Kingella negevensis]MDK4692857.1 Rrf2 family transcriptional regulator [Kingella negevensis]MDK4699157.1 Rrf2 family transcriptional regulator [Kingella negevensis]